MAAADAVFRGEGVAGDGGEAGIITAALGNVGGRVTAFGGDGGRRLVSKYGGLVALFLE